MAVSQNKEIIPFMYESLTKDQLISLLEGRDRKKKLGLVWERDEIEADRAVDENFVVAETISELCELAAPWSNLIIEGDNFDALRWLRMAQAGRFKCIYIDPPYNTGNKDWVYNDHYFDINDRYRHSTWLEFLFRRIVLARDLLTEDGVLLVSIDDDNRSRLDLLLEEAMPGMRIGSFVWRTKDTANDAERNLSSVHEHVLIYGKPGFSFLGHELTDKKYKNPDDDSRGRYTTDPLTKAHTYIDRANTYYPVQDPKTGWWYPCSPDRVWAYASKARLKPKQKLRAATMEDLIEDNRVVFPATEFVQYESMNELLAAIRADTAPKDGNGRALLRESLPDLDFWVQRPIALGRPSKKAFWDEKKSKIKPVSSYILGPKEKTNDDLYELISQKQGKATGEIQAIFGDKRFNYPKPISLLKSLLRAVVGPDDRVLDFFAGSATTAHALMELNFEDEGNRSFVLVSSTEATADEPGKNVCRDVTAKRIRLVNDDDANYPGRRAGFAYLRTRHFTFEDIDYDFTPAEVWAIIEGMHNLPLTGYEERPFQVHETKSVVLVYVDRFDPGLIDVVRRVRSRCSNIHVFAWAPGQISAQLEGLEIDVKPVRETLVKKFQQ